LERNVIRTTRAPNDAGNPIRAVSGGAPWEYHADQQLLETVCHWCHRTTEWVLVLRTDASSCGGAPTRILSQPPLHTGWHAPDGHAPDVLDLLPPEYLSPPEAWRLRDGAVPLLMMFSRTLMKFA
jgi:hypothetical protein